MLAVALGIALGSAGEAHAVQGARCDGGHFVVDGEALVTDGAGSSPDTVVIDEHHVSIASGCSPVRARMQRSRRGMRVKARWHGCNGLAGRVRLAARIDAACEVMAGVVRAPDARRRWRFRARRAPVCGDGVRDDREACDDGNLAPGDCCSPACGLEDSPTCAPRRCAGEGDCPAGTYCETDAGACGGTGVCRPRPEVCIGLLAPVCGCDGRTYVNACEAAAAGVSVAARGRCRDVCGTIRGIPCAPGEFCEHPPGTCEVADGGGTCEPIPQGCPDVFAPVCGCDGVTYGNDCERRAAAAQKAHDGPCGCVVVLCPPGSVPHDRDGDGCVDTCLPGVCIANEDCGRESYCAARPGDCAGRGICVRRPAACPRIHDPVCGCDGRTYSNACEAAAAGTRVATRGPCECPPILCRPGTLPVDRDGDGCPDTCFPPCREPCDCYLAPDLEFPEPCRALCATCDNFWVCEQGVCLDRCGPVPPGQGECPVPPGCATNEECAPSEYCAHPPGECAARGACLARPEACPATLVADPVCGCDGKTYGSACEAASAGVSVAARGPCPAVCGTIAGIPCPAGMLCEFPAGMCDAADLAGTCVPVPEACAEIFRPVCGCDGKTYANECERRAAGVQPAHDGPCRCLVVIDCLPGFLPHDTDGDGCDDTCLPARCATNADCPERAWCAAHPGQCREPGICVPRPTGCPRVLEPVCGCDGRTWDNPCLAATAGVRVLAAGPCLVADATSPGD